MPIHRSKPPNGKDQMKKTLDKTLSRTFDAIAARQDRADRLRAERDAMILARRKSNTLKGTLEAVWDTLNRPNGGSFNDRDIRPAEGPSPGRSPAPQFRPVPIAPPARAPLPLFAPTPEPSPPVLPGLFGLGAQASAAGFPGTINRPPRPPALTPARQFVPAPVPATIPRLPGLLGLGAQAPANLFPSPDTQPPARQAATVIGDTEFQIGTKQRRKSEALDVVQRVYEGYADEAGRRGLVQTSSNLRLFLAGDRFWKGRPRIVTYSRDQARSFPTIRDAEATNQKRFSDSLTEERVDPPENPEWLYPKLLLQVPDGKSRVFPAENWDIATSTIDEIFRGRSDFAFAFGRTPIISKGPLTATRRGNTIHINWPITHTWKDTYNFEAGQFLADGALALQDNRGARPFEIQSSWKQRLVGTIDIVNGKLINPQLKWIDVN